MIVREIKKKPEEILKNFDWFNDYKDTRQWALTAYPEIVTKLDEGYEKWLKREKANHNRHSNYDIQHLGCPNYPNCEEEGCGK